MANFTRTQADRFRALADQAQREADSARGNRDQQETYRLEAQSQADALRACLDEATIID